jgi:RNA polymerase sigma-70 factor (ECF subfamily)
VAGPGDRARSEEELIDAARAGEVRAFEELLERYESRVLRVVRLLGIPIDDREDVAQEAFVRAFRHVGGFRPGQDFGGWIYRIAVNACHDHRRTLRRRLARGEGALPAEEPPDRAPGPDRCLEQRDRRQRLETALESLSERERAVFVLCEMEGMGSPQVARSLNISSITVRRHLGRARRRLRETLKKMG